MKITETQLRKMIKKIVEASEPAKNERAALMEELMDHALEIHDISMLLHDREGGAALDKLVTQATIMMSLVDSLRSMTPGGGHVE
jgi:hypothetical protein